MAWRGICAVLIKSLLVGLLCSAVSAGAEESRFAATHSRSLYAHWIELYDATDSRIDPEDPNAAPYSPVFTCGRCHDYEAIAHGYHFNAMQRLTAQAGRPGEPWIWTDTRTGTQIPLSYRGWPGTYDPRALGISKWDFILKFGRHLPGGPVDGSDGEISARETDAADDAALPAHEADAAAPPDAPDNGRWRLSGQLAIDCMACHGHDGAYSMEVWWDQITKQNFAWAPAAALGIADVEGTVSRLPDDFDPSAKPPKAAAGDSSPDAPAPPVEGSDGEEVKLEAPQEPSAAEDSTPDIAAGAEAAAVADTGPSLPKTRYRALRISADKKVFFDVVRKPSDSVCYYCHTVRVTGRGEAPQWAHDEDVHLRAGMRCSDCHRHGIEHDTVRGFEGEARVTDVNVTTLTCRGCHMDSSAEAKPVVGGGRLGAPKPLHRGMPTIHLERLSCTACHSGPQPDQKAWQVQTAMAHGLGLPTHSLSADTDPGMAAPVMLHTEQGVLYPHRTVWPAFWGEMKDEQITPLHPDMVYTTLRSSLRVRGNSTFAETLGKVTLTAEDKAAELGEQRAQVAESELTAEEREKLHRLEETKATDMFRQKLVAPIKALQKAIKTEGAQAVYVAGGRAYRLAGEDAVEVFTHQAAEPYSWALAHDVRPARWSTGATNGCFDCHTPDAAIFTGRVAALGPAPDADPPTETMMALADFDQVQIDAWNQSFRGRTAFKWFGFASAGVVGLILLAFLVLGINGLFGFARRA